MLKFSFHPSEKCEDIIESSGLCFLTQLDVLIFALVLPYGFKVSIGLVDRFLKTCVNQSHWLMSYLVYKLFVHCCPVIRINSFNKRWKVFFCFDYHFFSNDNTATQIFTYGLILSMFLLLWSLLFRELTLIKQNCLGFLALWFISLLGWSGLG